eukprot:jgi/Ulvmu1/5845/UM025_0104.1
MPSILPQPPHISVSNAPGVSVRVDTVGRVLIELSARGRQVFVGPAAVHRSPLLASIAASAKPWETLALPVGEEPLCAWLEMVNDRQLDCRCVASEDQLVSAMTAADVLGDTRAVQDICYLLRPWLRRALGLRADRRPSTQHVRPTSATASAVRRKFLARSRLRGTPSSPRAELPSECSSPRASAPSGSLASGSMMSTCDSFNMAPSPGTPGMVASPASTLSVPILSEASLDSPVPPMASQTGGSAHSAHSTYAVPALPAGHGRSPSASLTPPPAGAPIGFSDVRMSASSGSSGASETITNSLFSWNGETATADAAYEVLLSVPPELAVTLLRRALAPSDPQPLHGEAPQIAVPAQFSSLPTKLRPLAVRACAPCAGVHLHVSIKFPELTHPTIGPSSISFASSAIPAVTSLTSLSLTFRRQARTSDGFDGKFAGLLSAACSLPHLATLRLSTLMMTPQRMHALARNLPRGRRLTALCLAAAPLADDADAAATLAEALTATPQLDRLELQDCKLVDTHVTALRAAFLQARSLAELSVTDAFLTTNTAAALAAAAAANPTCREVTINRVTHIECRSDVPAALAAALGGATSLRALTLRNYASRWEEHPLTEHLAERMRACQALTRLDLGESLGAGGAGPAGPIAGLLHSLPGLCHLNMCGAVIAEVEEAAQLTWAVGELAHLSHLDLWAIEAPTVMLEQLGHALHMHETLQVLRVSVRVHDGRVSSRSASGFAACLASMHVLRELELGYLAEDAVAVVAPVAAAIDTLAVLRLEHSELGCGDGGTLDEFVRELRLRRSCMLRVLSLAGNDLDGACMIELAKGLRSRTALRELDLSGNPMGVRGARKLARVLSGQVSFAGASGLGAGEGGCRPASLELLSLGGCGLCHDGIGAILPAVQSMQNLRELRVFGNPGVHEDEIRSAVPTVYIC